MFYKEVKKWQDTRDTPPPPAIVSLMILWLLIVTLNSNRIVMGSNLCIYEEIHCTLSVLQSLISHLHMVLSY